MPSKFPRFKDGDALTPKVLNTIMAELDRLRGLSGSGMISVSSADGQSPPQIIDHRQSTWVPASLTATLATGTVGSPTSAAATLMGLSGSTGPALTASNGPSITVYNTFALASSLTSGTQVWVTSFAGYWYLAQSSC